MGVPVACSAHEKDTQVEINTVSIILSQVPKQGSWKWVSSSPVPDLSLPPVPAETPDGQLGHQTKLKGFFRQSQFFSPGAPCVRI